MKPVKNLALLSSAVLACSINIAFAKVSEQEAARLEKDLTPLGAERAGNKDGSIPAWTGKMLGLPAGLTYGGDGTALPDPYASEKPLFVIDHTNFSKYKERLSEGQLALFAKYDDFKMPVYLSHRDGRYYPEFEAKTRINATHTELTNGIEGVANFSGGVPYPIPQNGAEVIWNTRQGVVYGTLNGVSDDIGVFANGSYAKRQQDTVQENIFSNPNVKVGTAQSELGVYSAYILVTVSEPARDKGKITLIHEPVDYVANSRDAWIYLPGTRRVRRAPTVGYDTPDGPGGLMTIDDMLGFNGAMDRFEWKLIGKRELYVPYHNYKFDDPNIKYETLLPKGHVNSDYMRYELHRVWVVEAQLKPSARHIYAKRRFYVDEDSWNNVASDAYDGHNELWRTSMINSVYNYAAKGYVNRALIYHDLRASHYVAIRMVNEQKGPPRLTTAPRGVDFFNPDKLRQAGTR